MEIADARTGRAFGAEFRMDELAQRPDRFATRAAEPDDDVIHGPTIPRPSLGREDDGSMTVERQDRQ